jgi:hypothetical protein
LVKQLFISILLRGPVVARKISYGTQSIKGNWCCEVFWSILETSKLKDINFGAYIFEALTANLEGKPVPSLVKIGESVSPKYVEEAARELKEFKKTLKEAKARKAKGAVRPFDCNTKPSEKAPECKESEPAKAEPEEVKPKPVKAEPEKVKPKPVKAEPEKVKAKPVKAKNKSAKPKLELAKIKRKRNKLKSQKVRTKDKAASKKCKKVLSQLRIEK